MASYNVFLGRSPKVFDIVIGDRTTTFDFITTRHTVTHDLLVHNLSYNKPTLGNLFSSMMLSSKVNKALSKKIIEIVDGALLATKVEVSAQKTVGELTNELTLHSEVKTKVGQYRTLLDLDGEDKLNTLAALDATSLGDLEFVIP